MRILFLSTTAQPERWLGPLGAALPGDEIVVYPEIGDPTTIVPSTRVTHMVFPVEK